MIAAIGGSFSYLHGPSRRALCSEPRVKLGQGASEIWETEEHQSGINIKQAVTCHVEQSIMGYDKTIPIPFPGHTREVHMFLYLPPS